MAAPSVTYTFTNDTAADATEVNQNFDDIINGITDGTKDITVNLLQANGAATFNGAVTLGNAAGDDITFTGRVASDIDPKTAATSTLGDATQTWRALYLDNTTTDGGAIYFDGDSTEFIKANAAGTELALGGFSALDLTGGQVVKYLVSAKSDDYTVLDDDGITFIAMTTGATDRTVTLPTASANDGRVITVQKVDSGAGKVTIDGEGSETIDGQTTVDIEDQYLFRAFYCNGTAWFSASGNSEANSDNLGLVKKPETGTIDISSSGDFSAGQNLLRYTKTSEGFVTIYLPVLSHTSLAIAESAAGLIPSSLRPTGDIFSQGIWHAGTSIGSVRIETDGTVQFRYYNPTSGAGVSRTTTAHSTSVTYWTSN